MQRLTLRELMDRHPGWQRRANDATQWHAAGQAPLVVSAAVHGRSLSELSLLLALANSRTLDPRRRAILYSYSGARGIAPQIARSIVIDPTALLNLGFLDYSRRSSTRR